MKYRDVARQPVLPPHSQLPRMFKALIKTQTIGTDSTTALTSRTVRSHWMRYKWVGRNLQKKSSFILTVSTYCWQRLWQICNAASFFQFEAIKPPLSLSLSSLPSAAVSIVVCINCWQIRCYVINLASGRLGEQWQEVDELHGLPP